MKIVYWAENVWPDIGGVETFSQQLIGALQERGHSFAVISSGRMVDGKPDVSSGVPVWRYPFAVAADHRDLRAMLNIGSQINALLQALRPDLIHLNTTGPSVLYYLRSEAAMQTPTLLTLHMPLTTVDRPGNMIARVLQSVAHVVGVSQASLRAALDAVPVLAERSSLILNALESPPVAPAPFPKGPPVILCVGRFTEQKGFDVALDAFALVIEQYPAATMVLAGDGDLRDTLEQQSNELGLNKHVRFVGRQSHAEIYRLLNDSTMLLAPSRYEPFGLVALEAAQMGRPVVASRVDGLSEIVAHQETGLLVKPESSKQTAEAILTLLNHPTLCVELGRRARQRAEAMFSFRSFLDKYEELYRQVCC